MSTLKVVNIQHPSAASATLILDSSGNLALPAGSASTPALQGPSDTNTGLFFPAADTIAFAEGGTEALRIDSSGRVGIGTSSPGDALHVVGKIAVTGTNPSIKQTVQTANLDLCGGTTVGTDPAIQLFGSSSPSDANHTFYNSNVQIWRNTAGTTQYGRFDSSGRLLLGTSANRNVGSSVGSRLQVEHQASAGVHGLSVVDTTDSAQIAFGTNNSGTVCSSGKLLARINFCGNDGTNGLLNNSAWIEAFADATWGSNDVPGRLVFSTTADGASSPTERMRITSNGYMRLGDGTTYYHTIRGGGGNEALEFTANAGQQAATTVSTIKFLNSDTGGAITERLRITNDGAVRHNLDRPGGAKNGYSTDSTSGATWAFLAQQNGSSTVLIQHDGNCQKPGGGAWNAISDERAKEEVADYIAGLEKIKQLKPRSYKYIGQDENTYYGLIAQECEGVMPEMVMLGDGKLPDGTEVNDYRTLNTTPLTFALINAVKELSAQNAALEARLIALESA